MKRNKNKIESLIKDLVGELKIGSVTVVSSLNVRVSEREGKRDRD